MQVDKTRLTEHGHVHKGLIQTHNIKMFISETFKLFKSQKYIIFCNQFKGGRDKEGQSVI